VCSIFEGEKTSKITRHCGPLTTEELLAGIPKPPPRLPNAHPDRYLAKLVIDPAGAKYALVAECLDLGNPEIRWFVAELDQAGGNPDGRTFFTHSLTDTNRFAQQDKDGVWREVSV
jgi:hypothetical protein